MPPGYRITFDIVNGTISTSPSFLRGVGEASLQLASMSMGHFIPRSKGIVLVVDDDPLLRLLAVDFIEDAGFEVVEAATADHAVAILEARTDIRIVFTDIDMPGSMDGMKLAAAVRVRWPPIEIIVVSGHKRHIDVNLPARAVFFPKPYDVDAVTATLNRMATIG